MIGQSGHIFPDKKRREKTKKIGVGYETIQIFVAVYDIFIDFSGMFCAQIQYTNNISIV
jgi:hypothetical protein